MSSERSSSAVRDLRSIFENKFAENSQQVRGRSSSGLRSESENSRPRSTVRASFVHVASPMAEIDGHDGTMPQFRQEDGEGVRGDGPSAGVNGSPAVGSKAPNASNQEKKEYPGKGLADSAAKSAVATPLAGVAKPLNAESPAQNPDKPVTGAEEEIAGMQPADPTDALAMSGEQGRPPMQKTLKKDRGVKAPPASKPSVPSKPPAVSTKDSPRLSVNAAKSPQSPKVNRAQRTSRSSLTAFTEDRTSSGNTKPTSPTTKREVTRPVNLSSHLTAPTAASRAKQDSTQPAKLERAARTKPISSATTVSPRTSLGGAQSSDGSFLERMTRPTVASASKTHDKVETSPRSKPPPAQPRAASTAKPVKRPSKQPSTQFSERKAGARAGLPAEPEPELELPQSKSAQPAPEDVKNAMPVQPTSMELTNSAVDIAAEGIKPAEKTPAISALDEKVEPAAEASEDHTGSETPQTNGHHNKSKPTTLESTPAAIGGQELIR